MSCWKNRVKPRIKQPLGGRNRRHGEGVLKHSNGDRGSPAWTYTFGFTEDHWGLLLKASFHCFCLPLCP